MSNQPSSHDAPQVPTTGTLPQPMSGDGSTPSVQEPVGPVTARDAVGLLTEDHRKTEMLFASYANARLDDSVEEKFSLAKQACGDLLIHMAIEEAIFYPKVRAALTENELVDAAEHEHDAAKELIRQLGEIEPADPVFDTTFEALIQHVSEHVEKEESVVFPKMLIAPVDLVALGQELATAKSDMRSHLGLPPE